MLSFYPNVLSRVETADYIVQHISVCHYLFSVTHASAFEASAIGKALPGSIATSALVMIMSAHVLWSNLQHISTGAFWQQFCTRIYK